jgi:hypothetical protein
VSWPLSKCHARAVASCGLTCDVDHPVARLFNQHDSNHRRAGLPLAVFWLGASCPLDESQLSAAKRATAQQFSIRPHLARPGHTPPGDEYRQFTGQPVTLPVDERALMAGVVSAHCSTSPPGRHCRGLVSRGERAPSGATDVDRHFGQLVSDHPLVAASVHSPIRVCSVHIVNGSVYNYEGNEGTMYSAPSPYDEPTKPIDVQTLRARWVHQRNETQVIEPRKPNRVASIDQK